MTALDHHLDALCAALETRLDAAPATLARRLLRPQLRWVEQQLAGGCGAELAQRLGVVDLIESCRNEHLATLDADAGLTVLQIAWQDVVIRACERGADRVVHDLGHERTRRTRRR